VKTSEMMLKTLVDNASEGIAIIDKQGLILDANRKFYDMHGKEWWEKGVSRNITDIYADSNNRDMMRKKIAVLSQEPGVLFEMTMKGEDKEEITVEIAVTSINVGSELVFLAFYRDISERKLLYQQLAHAQKMESLGNLACGISHDFKNVLGTVLGYVDLMRYASDSMESRTAIEIIKSNTDMIGHEVKRAKEILSNLLNIGSKGGNVDYSVLDLNAIIKTSRDVYSNLFPDIAVEVDLCEKMPAVVGSESQIEQVLSNLFMNAKDAMPSGGNIRITTGVINKVPFVLDVLKEKTAEEYVLISFADTGMGISEENLPHIFEPFYTLKKSADNSVSGGTGLGLAMVYGIIKEHRGMITVQSRVSEGTTFNIYFPCAGALSSQRNEILTSSGRKE
jgi:PAS domain S-box-containing protein